MLESFLCFCLSPSRKGISGCAAGEGEKVYSRAMGKGFGTLCAKKSPYSSSTGLHLAATNLQQAVPCSHPFLTPQSIPGDHHGHRELQGDSRLPLLCAALILLAKPSMQHPPEGGWCRQLRHQVFFRMGWTRVFEGNVHGTGEL